MRIFFITSLLILNSCVSSKSETPSGIQDTYRSYIPARTAVLSCQLWPSHSIFSSYVQSNGDESVRREFCKTLDAYVLDAFKDQNFMRGFTPHAVQSALQAVKKETLLDTIFKDWTLSDSENCSDCEDIASFYKRIVQNKTEWRQWLLEFSKSTRYTDAILIPFVSFAREEKSNDRGLLFSKRSMGVTVLLIDTQTGDLIWNTKRQSMVSTQKLETHKDKEHPEFPSWAELTEKLFINSLWREYPGRVF